VTQHLNEYAYAEATRVLYDFAWDEFCSFYAEMCKPRFEDPATRPVAQRVMAHVLDVLLRLLHPMMPFMTEEVWQLLGQVAPQRGIPDPQPASESLVIAPWPAVESSRQDEKLEAQFAQFQAVLGAVREIRSRQNINPRDPVEFCVQCDDSMVALLQPMEVYFQRMAKASCTGWGPQVTPPPSNAQISVAGSEVFVDLKDFLDIPAEIDRNAKQEKKLLEMIARKEQQLSNENFVSRARPEVVQKERDSLQEMQDQLATTRDALARLRALQG
jgi:valyl-tRNA synthetase